MRRVVVGLDGTPASLRAIEWAASFVGPAGSIHAVTAVSHLAEFTVDVITGDPDGFVREIEHDIGTRWVRTVRGRVAHITTHVREQAVDEALHLVAAECDAHGIVIGAHVPGRVLPTTIGRTTRHLLRDLACPLIVVPSEADDHVPHPGPVVVGIGHGEATEHAAWWASELADEHDLMIGLIRATGDAPIFEANGIIDVFGYYLDPASRRDFERGDIARLAMLIQENSDHELAISIDVGPGLSAVRLVEASETASMLVIGQHWSGLTRGRHTPQPLRYALAHARCPVAVIPEAAVHVG